MPSATPTASNPARLRGESGPAARRRRGNLVAILVDPDLTVSTAAAGLVLSADPASLPSWMVCGAGGGKGASELLVVTVSLLGVAVAGAAATAVCDARHQLSPLPSQALR